MTWVAAKMGHRTGRLLYQPGRRDESHDGSVSFRVAARPTFGAGLGRADFSGPCERCAEAADEPAAISDPAFGAYVCEMHLVRAEVRAEATDTGEIGRRR